MTTDTNSKPLWYQIEEQIGGLKDADLAASTKEKTVHKLAAALDENGLNVSRTGGKLLSLRRALDARIQVGRPLIDDLNEAMTKFALEDLLDVRRATFSVTNKLEEAWPMLSGSEVIADLRAMLEATKLDLMIEKAKGLGEDGGIRYLRDENITTEIILERLDVSQELLDQVDAAIAAEKAELKRVQDLFADVNGKPEIDQIKHLLSNEASDALIIQIAEVTESAIASAKKAMEEELKEQQRLAEEAAEKKRKEAEGPSIDDISSEDMLNFVEDLREILDFCDAEKEIRAMAAQSDVPKCLVDIAISDPDRLDDLEEAAEA